MYIHMLHIRSRRTSQQLGGGRKVLMQMGADAQGGGGGGGVERGRGKNLVLSPSKFIHHFCGCTYM